MKVINKMMAIILLSGTGIGSVQAQDTTPQTWTLRQCIDYAIEHCGADWREQCAQSAQQYLGNLDMSRSELYDQLEFEGFTPDQIAYGLSCVGY